MWPRSAKQAIGNINRRAGDASQRRPRATRGRGFSSGDAQAAPRLRQFKFALQMGEAEAGQAGATGNIDQIAGLGAIAAQGLTGSHFAESRDAEVERAARGVAADDIDAVFAAAQAKKPSANLAIHCSSTVGNAPASVAQRGLAPIAARSERLTASAFQPRLSGSVSGKKWVPATSMSVVTASCMPGVG
jgi:hypothetical protein